MKENRSLEFKSEITNTFLKTVSAFSNFGNGEIVFGVADDGSVVGISDPEKACLDIENRINDSISPKPDYRLQTNRRTNVITLTVLEGSYKPYLYRGKAYRRSDTATIEVDQIELKRLTLEGSNLYFEELPYGNEKLTFHYFAKKLKEKLDIDTVNDDVLRTLGFFTKEKRFNIAAALFADENRFSGIDIARFGETISEIQNRVTVFGLSVLKQYDTAVAEYRRYYQVERIEGIDRIANDLIPEAAFREAVANALVHRLWDINAHIRISMYTDRIEIASPGGLPTGLSEAEYLNGYISTLRNPILGNVFFRMHYIEMFGTGIRRILESYRKYEVKPTFRISENAIIVILPTTNQRYQTTTEGQIVLKLFDEGRLLSKSEIADKTGWSKDKTIRVINELKKNGAIKTVGNGRGTKYSKN